MAQLKIVAFAISEDGNLSIDIGPGTHGADCADIIEGFGQAVGVITKEAWVQEINCKGDCAGCETDYWTRRADAKILG